MTVALAERCIGVEVILEHCRVLVRPRHATSHDYDRSKLRAYAMAGVKEVWLLLVPEKQIEVHSEPGHEGFDTRSIHGPDGRFSRALLPAFSMDLATFFEN
jgi:Uma2 family endonuclease